VIFKISSHEDIEDIPIVEVTYPETFPIKQQPMAQPEVEIPNEQHTLHAPPKKDDAPIVNISTADSHIIEQVSPLPEPISIDKVYTEAQHGSRSSEI